MRRAMQRLIAPFELRHLRVFSIVRFVAAAVTGAAGIVCLANAAYWWAAFFLVVSALSLVVGYWEAALSRDEGSSPRSPRRDRPQNHG